jgi:hypothetical protein
MFCSLFVFYTQQTAWPAKYNERMTEVLELLKTDAMSKLKTLYAEYQALP